MIFREREREIDEIIMNDQFGGFDLNSFGIDSFTQGTSSSTTQQHAVNTHHPQQRHHHQQQQQQQQPQRYVTANSNCPCMDNYDPNQVFGSVPTYNAMPSHQSHHSYSHPVRTSNSVGNTRNDHTRGPILGHSYSHNQHHRHHHPTHQTLIPPSAVPGGFTDFEPIPIPKGDARRVQQQHHQQLTSSRSNFNNQPIISNVNHCRLPHYSHQQHPQTQTQQQLQSKLAPEIISSSDYFEISYHHQKHQPQPKPQPPPSLLKELWLEELQVKVAGVSLEPMSGMEIMERMKLRSNEVLTRYLPCVDFLVQCQQELRKGLQVATVKRYVNHMFRDTMTPRQFYTNYISNLPERFYRKNKRIMDNTNITAAVKELQTLCTNAKAAESQGCEVVKNTFLGGMKDGESWGLRKWLSKQGGALHICNDTECLSNSCQKLNRDLDTTKKLAARLRPLAENSLKRLKSEIPSSYQEQSSAHPYLPFFHRLECALRGMANFDPEDDDVICIDDDDEVEELKAKVSAAVPPTNKRKPDSNDDKNNTRNNKPGGSSSTLSLKRKAPNLSEPFVALNDEGGDSDIEILERKPPAKRNRDEDLTASYTSKIKITNDLDGDNDNVYTLDAETGDDSDIMKELLKTLDDNDDDPINFDEFDEQSNNDVGETKITSNIDTINAFDLAHALESLASLFDSNQHDKVRPSDIVGEEESFWDDSYRYASALRLFSGILRSPDCTCLFLESVDEDELTQEGKLPYGDIVKHPLCFRDIVSALLHDFNATDNSIECSNGMLPFGTILSDWNMWKGMELLQAIDLVFLNSLAYGKANDGVSKSSARSQTNKLRKVLWAGIKQVIDDHMSSADVEERRRCTPTRRGESSGFVVRKSAA